MTRGLLTTDDLAGLVDTGKIDTVVVAFTDHYGRLHGKRFEGSYFLEDIARAGTHGCDYLLTVDMEMEPVPGYKYANWELGYGDFHMVPDLGTMRVASWLDRSAIVLSDLHDPHHHDLVAVAPRTILRRQLERAGESGFTAQGASEIEYFLFQDSYRDAAARRYQDLNPVGWYIEDYHLLQGMREEKYNGAVRRHLSASGIPVENSKGEWGRGQHEMNIRYAEVLEMADRHSIMKLAMKEIAESLDMSVTFMAKPQASEAGSSCHIHLSLWTGEDNAFPGDVAEGPISVSPAFRHFLGGWMAHVPEVMPFLAPTINSFKRYQDASWAPTRIGWSHDNRTAGFRVVGQGSSLRIECRIPGADCNPYLAFAASLASGLDGIRHHIEPPACFEGDIYASRDLPHVPRSLEHATALFKNSDFAKHAFGADVVEHYAHFYESEQAAFSTAVTDWERRRYFERI